MLKGQAEGKEEKGALFPVISAQRMGKRMERTAMAYCNGYVTDEGIKMWPLLMCMLLLGAGERKKGWLGSGCAIDRNNFVVLSA